LDEVIDTISPAYSRLRADFPLMKRRRRDFKSAIGGPGLNGSEGLPFKARRNTRYAV